MKSFSVTTAIRAPAAAIWSVLTDAASYPKWNSTVTRVDGRIESGGKVTVHAKSSPGRAFPLKVTEFAAPQRMVWSGGMPLGLFRGERTYTLRPLPDGTVEFNMREEFTGVLAPLITRSIPDLQPDFNVFAADLKRHVEKGA